MSIPERNWNDHEVFSIMTVTIRILYILYIDTKLCRDDTQSHSRQISNQHILSNMSIITILVFESIRYEFFGTHIPAEICKNRPNPCFLEADLHNCPPLSRSYIEEYRIIKSKRLTSTRFQDKIHNDEFEMNKTDSLNVFLIEEH